LQYFSFGDVKTI